MILKVTLFAMAKQLFGQDFIEVELSGDATVEALRDELIHRCPKAAELLERSAISVDCEFATAGQSLSSESDVAFDSTRQWWIGGWDLNDRNYRAKN